MRFSTSPSDATRCSGSAPEADGTPGKREAPGKARGVRPASGMLCFVRLGGWPRFCACD